MNHTEALRVLINGSKSEKRIKRAKAKLKDLSENNTLDDKLELADKLESMREKFTAHRKLKAFTRTVKPRGGK